MPVGLCDADVDRQIGAAVESYIMHQSELPGPIGFGQSINAERATESPAVDGDRPIGERVEIDVA